MGESHGAGTGAAGFAGAPAGLAAGVAGAAAAGFTGVAGVAAEGAAALGGVEVSAGGEGLAGVVFVSD